MSDNLAFKTNLAAIAAILLWLAGVYTSLPMKVFKSVFETSKAAMFCYLEYYRPP